MSREEMRKQYFFRSSARGPLAWDVDRLIELSRDLPIRRIPLAAIRELELPWFGDGEDPSWRSMIEHIRLIHAANLSYPIILSETGEVMDGMHRAAKALLEGCAAIDARQFLRDPEPDHVGRGPDDLAY